MPKSDNSIFMGACVVVVVVVVAEGGNGKWQIYIYINIYQIDRYLLITPCQPLWGIVNQNNNNGEVGDSWWFLHFTFLSPVRAVGAPLTTSATGSLHLFLFSTAPWELANSSPVHSLMLSHHLFFSQPLLRPSLTVP